MLTQLPSLKSRLALLPSDTTYDSLLTFLIQSLSNRFDLETNRTLARTENATFEFDAFETEIAPPCYPIESVKSFALKSDEAEGCVALPQPAFLVRNSCVISLALTLAQPTTLNQIPIAQITYTGGYVLPGTNPGPGQTPLPSALEQAVIEQATYWFQCRDKLGLRISWPSGGEYRGFTNLDLLPSVQTVLSRFTRLQL